MANIYMGMLKLFVFPQVDSTEKDSELLFQKVYPAPASVFRYEMP